MGEVSGSRSGWTLPGLWEVESIVGDPETLGLQHNGHCLGLVLPVLLLQ